MMSLSNKYALSEEVILDKLADRVKTEIKPQKVADRKPGDDLKPTMNEVARQTGIDRTAISLIANRKIKSLPNLTTLMKLCNAFDCELDYLLGFQEHKKKEIGSVTDITGLSEEVVEVLAEDFEFKKEHFETGIEELTADQFLEYLILNQQKTKLLQRIRQENAYIRVTREYRENQKSYQIAKDAFEKAYSMLVQGSPVMKLYSKGRDRKHLQSLFVTLLAGRLHLNEEDVDKWATDEFGVDTFFLVGLFELDRTRAERIRVIEDCFTDLVKDYLREVESNAEK